MKHILSYNALLEHAKSDYNPLSKLLNAGYTGDRRYVIVEGKAYSCETGERAPLNEEWSVSDVLHLGADVLSMGIDFVIPGSGAIVDTLNAISYLIEAQFVDSEKKSYMYTMAAITFAFVILPGPLQAISIPLKRFIKNGAGKLAAKGPVKKALEFISGKLGYILKVLPGKIKSALTSKLGKTLLGRTGSKKVIGAVKAFSDGVTAAFNRIMGRPDDVVKSTLAKSSVKTLTKDALKKVLPENTIQLLKKVFSRAPKAIPAGAKPKILKKLGYVPGKPYRYIDNEGKAATVIIEKQTAKGEVIMKYVNQTFKSGKKNDYKHIIPLEEFVSKAIGAPWGRRGYTAAAPFFIKQYAKMINSAGEIDPALLDQLNDLDPNATSAESLAFLQEEVGSYEGDAGTYTVDQDVTSAQTMLSKIVYPITIDGKFGPQTKEALEKFQQDYGLSTSLGKLDNATMLKLKEVSGL
jgi:hypothetical protein